MSQDSQNELREQTQGLLGKTLKHVRATTLAASLVPLATLAVCTTVVSMQASGGTAPVANAGPDQTVNEEQFVTLDATGSTDADGDPLTYSWVQIGGPPVALYDDTSPQPTFTAPFVGLGGATLTFELTVSATDGNVTDTVDVTVANVNHTPVANAGPDQSIAEGSPVALNGSGSFDIDGDPFTYAWVQQSGPVVALTGGGTGTPSFTAPVIISGGAPGVVATLVFKLTVDDGLPPDAPAAGYTFADIADTVTVQITNTNNLPVANAGPDQTVNENSPVILTGAASTDPDSDTLSYAWTQVGGPFVTLGGSTTATPTLTAPFVGVGGVDVTFELTVNDGYGGTAKDRVIVHVQNSTDPPLITAARPTIACLWPPNHKLVAVGITGVSDPSDNTTITINSVTQDEPTNGLGDGDTPVDAVINGSGTVLLRAERSGTGNGRVYHIHFTASNFEGSASGMVTVCVPHDQGKNNVVIDGGELYSSTN